MYLILHHICLKKNSGADFVTLHAIYTADLHPNLKTIDMGNFRVIREAEVKLPPGLESYIM